jgi:hypothetical protein
MLREMRKTTTRLDWLTIDFRVNTSLLLSGYLDFLRVLSELE